MGTICTHSKTSLQLKQGKTRSQISYKAQLFQQPEEQKEQNTPLTTQKVNSEQNFFESNRLMLTHLKVLCQLIELLGSLDELSNNTRTTLNTMIIIRSNLVLLIKSVARKEMKSRGIPKQKNQEEDGLLSHILKVEKILSDDLMKVAWLVDNKLRINNEFEQVFPILSMAFYFLADDIKKLSKQLVFYVYQEKKSQRLRE